MYVHTCTAYLFGEDILRIDELVLFGYQVSPQRGSGSVQGQIISLLVTVAHKSTKPIYMTLYVIIHSIIAIA